MSGSKVPVTNPDQITPEQREKAWAWVEDARGPVEEMGQ